MKKGDIISTTEYLKVTNINSNYTEVVNLETQEKFKIDNALVVPYDKADTYESHEKVSMTMLAEILCDAGDKVFNVTYTKQPKALEVANNILSMTAKDSKSKAKVEALMKGEERTLRGRLLHSEQRLGRSNVIDLDIEKEEGSYDNRRRLVDHRTITSIIIGNTLYTLK